MKILRAPRSVHRQLSIAWALAPIFAASAAQALTVMPPSFETLVAEAEIVVDGVVSEVRSELSSYQGRQLVHTYVTIRVFDSLKGQPGDSVQLRILGGTVGDFTLQVSGVPKFGVGDRNLFFIAGNGSAFCPLVAVPHGYYPIEKRESDDAEIVVRSNLAPLVDSAGVSEELHGVSSVSRGRATTEGAMTLAEFKSQIREEVARASDR